MLEDLSGPRAGALLGVAWDFGAFNAAAPVPAEFDLPGGWGLYAERLAAMSGIRLETHCSDEHEDAYDRLDFGQPVVLAVDSYQLPYRPAYRRVHSARTILATRIDRPAGTAEIVDVWMPAYTGTIALADLDRARISAVPYDVRREPLYSGTPLHRRWWTLALLGDPLMAQPSGIARALGFLAAQSAGGRLDPAEALEQSRRMIVAALAAPIAESQAIRRAAALWLRGAIGLRAYLVSFLRLAAQLDNDALLAAEVAAWSAHLHQLACARDIVIKSTVFARAAYADLADRALGNAVAREGRFIRFMGDLYGAEPSFARREQSSC
jgi:hypothetical protein